MTERHGKRRDRPADEPAPTITSKARSDVVLRMGNQANALSRSPDYPAPTVLFGHALNDVSWVVNTRQRSRTRNGPRDTEYKRASGRDAPTLTAQTGGFWQWERPSTTVCGDARIPAPGYRTADDRSLTPCVCSEQAATGEQDGTEAIKLTLEEALILQGFSPDFPVQGSRTKRFQQIGNAVPPALAEAIVRALTE